MADRIIAPIALLMFIVFLGFLTIYINEIDLWVIIVLVAGMAVYDFWESLRGPSNGASSSGPGA